jgi:hypothetical protein
MVLLGYILWSWLTISVRRLYCMYILVFFYREFSEEFTIEKTEKKEKKNTRKIIYE